MLISDNLAVTVFLKRLFILAYFLNLIKVCRTLGWSTVIIGWVPRTAFISLRKVSYTSRDLGFLRISTINLDLEPINLGSITLNDLSRTFIKFLSFFLNMDLRCLSLAPKKTGDTTPGLKVTSVCHLSLRLDNDVRYSCDGLLSIISIRSTELGSVYDLSISFGKLEVISWYSRDDIDNLLVLIGLFSKARCALSSRLDL